MQIEVNATRIHITEQIDKHIKKKLNNLGKYFRRILSIRVTLRREKGSYLTEINVTAEGVSIRGNGVDSDLHSSVEVALHKIDRQARKHKEKVKSHRSRNTLTRKGTLSPASPASSVAEDKTIYTSREIPKPMTADEAVMQLESERNLFFIFLNSSTNQINVVYRKKSGDFVVVEPQI